MVKKPSDLSDGLAVVKKKSLRDDLPKTLRAASVNGKIHMNVTNTGQGELHILEVKTLG